MAKKDKKKAARKAEELAAKKAEKKRTKKAAKEKAGKPTTAEPAPGKQEGIVAGNAAATPGAPAAQAPRPEKPADGKPRKTLPPVAEGEPWKTVSIKMPISRVEAVDAAARAHGGAGVSRSEYIRMALEEFLVK